MSTSRSLRIPVGRTQVEADVVVPTSPHGLVVFAHGSGSSRFSPRNRQVAERLQGANLATALMDLLTQDEELADEVTTRYRFNTPMLAERLEAAVEFLKSQKELHDLPIGLFGASTGAGAALIASVRKPGTIAAIVSRGGRPDLAGQFLPHVTAPTLLVVGQLDHPDVLRWNKNAAGRLAGPSRLEIVPGAGHLFEQPGALEKVAELATDWFLTHLAATAAH